MGNIETIKWADVHTAATITPPIQQYRFEMKNGTVILAVATVDYDAAISRAEAAEGKLEIMQNFYNAAMDRAEAAEAEVAAAKREYDREELEQRCAADWPHSALMGKIEFDGHLTRILEDSRARKLVPKERHHAIRLAHRAATDLTVQYEAQLAALRARVAELEAAGEWRPVTDEWPPKGGLYLGIGAATGWPFLITRRADNFWTLEDGGDPFLPPVISHCISIPEFWPAPPQDNYGFNNAD